MSEAVETQVQKDPDELLAGVTRKGLGGSLVLSFLAHVLLIGLTSFGIYAAWAKWGVHTPNEIKQLEKAAAKEAAEAAKAADDKTPPLEREVAKPVKSFDLDALDL